MEKVNECPISTLAYELFLESFYGKKKWLIFLTVFYIFHESSIKNFRKWSINKCTLRALIDKTIFLSSKVKASCFYSLFTHVSTSCFYGSKHLSQFRRERERKERDPLLGRGGEHIREKRKWEKVLGKLKMGRAFDTMRERERIMQTVGKGFIYLFFLGVLEHFNIK